MQTNFNEVLTIACFDITKHSFLKSNCLTVSNGVYNNFSCYEATVKSLALTFNYYTKKIRAKAPLVLPCF